MKSYLPIILILLSIGAYYMYIKPTYADVQILTEEKKSNEEILAKANNIMAKRDEIIRMYDALTPEELNKLDKIIPTTFDETIVANHINTIASKYGLVIDQIDINNSNQVINSETMMGSNLYKEQTGSFKTEGSYENFISLIKDLELDMSIIDIISISISSGGTENSKSQNLMYDIQFKTYSLN